MSDKSNNKKFKSIAIKLNSIFVRKMFFEFVILDIIFISAFYALGYFDFNDSYFCHVIISIGIVEILMILKEIIFGTQRIRKVLKPLNDIAKSTERLSNISFDETSIENLEQAISNISPEGNSEKIHTGDSELSGIEEAINNLLERMREAYRRQARFVSDASHELRTPIAVIQGYVNMLDRWGKEDKKVLDESIEAIKSESDNMKKLVEQLLFLARGINGKTKVDFKGFSMKDMINEIYEESKMIDEEHIYILEDNEDIKAYGDVRLIKETARVLIENARKYTASGGCIKLSFGKEKNKGKCQRIDDSILIS